MGEIAPIIGSLAQYDVSILIEAGVLLPLFEALDSQDIRVLEATARALRSVVQHPLSIPLNSITVYFANLECSYLQFGDSI